MANPTSDRAPEATSSHAPGRRCFHARALRCLAAAAAIGWIAPAITRGQATLVWDPQQAGGGSDGSGTWDSGNTANPVWSTGTVDTDWDNAVATIARFGNVGTATGAANLVTLGSDITAAAVTVNPAGPGGSYTFNAAGHALAAAGGNLVVTGVPVTLTNGTYAFGSAGGAIHRASVSGGGTLTLGAGATLATAIIRGDGTTSASTVRFDGGTFLPLATVNVPATGGAYYNLIGTTNAYVAAGGLTVDTSFLASQSTPSYAILADPLRHDPSIPGIDGGFTLVGGGLVYDGDNNPNPTASAPSRDPVNTYSGTTNVSNGILALSTAGNASTTGPFPNTRFVVAAHSLVVVTVNDALAGATGTTPVTLNGGILVDEPGVTCHLANVTSAGGEITGDTDANGAAGLFVLRTGAELRATTNPTQLGLSAGTTVDTVNLALEAGSDVRADPNAYVLIVSPIVDESATVPSQLTVNGSGTGTSAGFVALVSATSYTGGTTVRSGELDLEPFSYTTSSGTVTTTGTIGGSKAITVAAGATLFDGGFITSVPTVTVNGAFVYSRASTAAAGPEVLTLAGLTLGSTNGAGGTVTLGTPLAAANRKVLVTGGLTIAGSTNAWVGTVNLSANDMVVQNGNLATVTNQVATGYANGAWTGSGIASSAAAANPARLTALGVIVNNDGAGNRLYGPGAPLGLFSTTSPGLADVLVRYTYYGDANLDGKVDGADYTRIDAGYAAGTTGTSPTGWYNGDFNYDGKVDGSDYTLIDNAFDLQSAATPLVPNALVGSGDVGARTLANLTFDLNPAVNAGGISTAGSFARLRGDRGTVASATSEVAPAAVPEPASLAVLAVGVAGLLGRRRGPRG